MFSKISLFSIIQKFRINNNQVGVRDGPGLHRKISRKVASAVTNLFITCIACTILMSTATVASENPQETSKTEIQESASVAAVQKSESNPLPVLLTYAPLPCVQRGATFTISGKNLRPKTTSKQDVSFVLLMDLRGKQQALTTSFWSENKIAARIPENMGTDGSVKISIAADNREQSKPLSIKICIVKPDTEAVEPSKEIVDSDDLENTENTENSTTIESISNVSDTTQPDRPTIKKDGPDKAADDMNRRLANHRSAGGLIGLGLPNLPAELKISQPKEKDTYVPDELVAVSADMENAKQLATFLSKHKARVIRRKKMSSLGLVLSTFKLPVGAKVNDFLTLLREQQPETWIDANHLYYSNSKAKITSTINKNRETHFANIALSTSDRCEQNIRIGLLDGPVDDSVDSLAGQSITQKQMFSRGKKAGSSKHATAIASLIVGSVEFPAFFGAISNAELFIGVVMQQDPNDKKQSFATTENLALGLDWLVKQKVQVVNLSLGGPRNAILEVVLSRVLLLEIGVVAAAGNGGDKSKESYPAAQEGVIAVSAVDSDGMIAPEYHQGDYIDLAAPGIDLWVPSKGSKGHYLSGSSLASPLVAAALARLGGSPKKVELLFRTALDKGQTGKDIEYGWGILQFPECQMKKAE